MINTEIRFGVPKDKVTVGDRVLMSRVAFETVNHRIEYIPGRVRGGRTKQIVIGEKV